MREFDCVISKDRVRWLSSAPDGDDVYQVNACGHLVTYICNDVSETCLRESEERRRE